MDAGCGGGGGPRCVVWRACGAEPAGGHGGDPAGLSHGGGRRAGDPGAGEGGHGARPHQSVDAVWLAARVITELQQTIARRLDALQPVVISFGKVEGGRAFNVIADQVRLLGTVRCLDLQQHAQLPAWIDETVQGICASGGVRLW